MTDAQQSTFDQFVSLPENRRLYEEERLLVDATELLSTVMDATDTKRAQLAQRLQCSKAHVTQILRGNHNLTLRTLAGAFHAMNYRLLMVAEPLAAGNNLIVLRKWDVTQQAGNAVVANDYVPSDQFDGEKWAA
jgi:transcriptional regulator with XRE-family HTH domain